MPALPDQKKSRSKKEQIHLLVAGSKKDILDQQKYIPFPGLKHFYVTNIFFLIILIYYFVIWENFDFDTSLMWRSSTHLVGQVTLYQLDAASGKIRRSCSFVPLWRVGQDHFFHGFSCLKPPFSWIFMLKTTIFMDFHA